MCVGVRVRGGACGMRPFTGGMPSRPVMRICTPMTKKSLGRVRGRCRVRVGVRVRGSGIRVMVRVAEHTSGRRSPS